MPAWEYLYMWREDGLVAFSQNFITDPNLVYRLIKKSNISIDDIVIEIGAGKGVITKQLCKTCKHVWAIEIDKNLYHILINNLKVNNLTIINNNILKTSLPKTDYKVFSNIPFNYTSRIMNKLYFQSNPPQSAYIVMQREACNIYTGSFRETQKSLFLKPFFSIEICHNFNRSDFRPVPKVDIYMLSIQKRPDPLIESKQTKSYYDFIVYGTSQHKRTLKSGLSKIFTHKQFKKLSQDLGFSINAKPMDLDYAQWISLFKYYTDNISDSKKSFVIGTYRRQISLQSRLKKRYRTT